jgi:PPE-repeat protein
MAMDFGALPPEINSARMYAGAGAGSMLAAAAAWDGLAADLYSTAASYGSVISRLTGESWQGASSASMAAAAAPYTAWMSATAAQAEQVANQARAAASAHAAAFAMTVPPPLIAANRAQLMTLVATNFLGVNTPAIMATEAHYMEMWAQDAAAMYGYAGSSAAASTLAPFTPPAHTTNPGGLAGQAVAVAHATGTSVGTHANAIAAHLSMVPQTLQGLAQPIQATSSSSGLSSMELSLGGLSSLLGGEVGLSPTDMVTLGVDAIGVGSSGGVIGVGLIGLGVDILGADTVVATEESIAPVAGLGMSGLLPAGGIGQLAPIGGLGSTGAAASMGNAASVGALSVPQSWATAPAAPISPPGAAPISLPGATALPGTNLGAVPPVGPVAASAPATSLGPAAKVEAGSSGKMFSEMLLASMAGRAIGGAAAIRRRERGGATNGAEAPPPRSQDDSLHPVKGIAAELRQLADLRDSGILTDEEFNEQKRRLLGRPRSQD